MFATLYQHRATKELERHKDGMTPAKCFNMFQRPWCCAEVYRKRLSVPEWEEET